MINMRKQQSMGVNIPNSNSQPAGKSGVNTSHGFGKAMKVPDSNGYMKMPSSLGKLPISQPGASIPMPTIKKLP